MRVAPVGNYTPHRPATDALLIESNVNLDEHDVFMARAEWAKKSGEELALDTPDLDEALFGVGKRSLGYLRKLGAIRGFVPALGGQMALSLIPARIESLLCDTARTRILVLRQSARCTRRAPCDFSVEIAPQNDRTFARGAAGLWAALNSASPSSCRSFPLA